MKKSFLILLGFFFLISIVSCGTSDAESDNDSGFDNEAVADDDETADDEATDDAKDETADNPAENIDDGSEGEAADKEDDETTDEINDDDDGTTEELFPEPSEDSIKCCEEIVKEWHRCDGKYDKDAVDGCYDCLTALLTCYDFYTGDNSFACTDECNALCEGSGTANNTGKDRRKIADEYCRFIMNKNCGIAPDDVSSFGLIEGLDGCYDE
ncbi:MAG: hypothetical protein ACOX2F_02145 [bacterium]